jgi:hypothetical protein
MSGKPKIEMTGKKCGRLTVLEHAGSKSNQVMWRCKCECGSNVVVRGNDLRAGYTTSCGCVSVEKAANLNRTHGMSQKGGAYTSWLNMIQRCCNPNNKKYEQYGGRGIKVCDRWKSFEAFYQDLGLRPKGYSIERIDVNGNYEPSNCKWLPFFEQSKNRRTTRYVRLKGEIMTQAEAARRIGKAPQTLNDWRHKPYRIPADLDLVFTF